MEETARRRIRVGVSPWEQLKPECFDCPSEVCPPGLELDVLRLIATMLNLTVELLVHRGDTGCGRQATNGTKWTSLLGMLYRGEIDLIGNLCKLDANRAADFQPSFAVINEYLGFVIRSPTEHSYEFNPLAPFTPVIWGATGLITILFLLILVVFRLTHEQDASLLTAVKQSSEQLMMYMLQYRRPPRQLGWICVIAFFMLMKSMYSSYIRNVLVNPHYVYMPFSDQDSFLRLLTSGTYRLIDYQPRDRVKVYGLSRDGDAKLQAAIEKHGYVHAASSDPNVLLTRLIASENLVLAKSDLNIHQYLTGFSNPSRLWKLPVNFAPSRMCYFWRKNFSYADNFNQAIIQIGDHLNNEVDRRYNKKPIGIYSTHQIQPTFSESQLRSLSTFKIPLYIYTTILMVSACAMFAERFAMPALRKARRPSHVSQQQMVTMQTTAEISRI